MPAGFTLTSFDETSFAIGNAILDGSEFYGFYVASDNYDFWAVSEAGVYGVNLKTCTLELLLSGESISGVGIVFPAEDGTWLVSHTNYIDFGVNLYLATEKAATDIPEPNTVTLAVSDTDNLDDYIQRVITQYNFEHSDFRVEVVSYQDEQLKLAITSSNVPDIILFDNTHGWESVNPDILQKNGYLENLTSFFDSDSKITQEDILPGILDSIQYEDGIYSIPYGYQYRTIYCKSAYGTSENWSLEELIETALSLPDNVVVEETTQSYFLEQVMQWCLSDFVDEKENICNFETPLFYDLLTICKEKMPSNNRENTGVEEYLCNYAFSMFGFSDLCNTLQQAGDGVVFSGFPDADGGQFGFSSLLSISATSLNKDAAWEFVSTLLVSNGSTVYESIRKRKTCGH